MSAPWKFIIREREHNFFVEIEVPLPADVPAGSLAHREEAGTVAMLATSAPDLYAALKLLTEHAEQASAWVPHVLLIEAVSRAKTAIEKVGLGGI